MASTPVDARWAPLLTEERCRVQRNNDAAIAKVAPTNILPELFSPPPWMADALCRSFEDPDLWTSSDPQDVAQAVEACFFCPVRRQCFLFTWGFEAVNYVYHVSGGTSARSRNRLHSKYADPARAYEQVKPPVINRHIRPDHPCPECHENEWYRWKHRSGAIEWRCVECHLNKSKARREAKKEAV